MNLRSIIGFIGAAIFATLLSWVLVWIMSDFLPPFTSERAYFLVVCTGLAFLLMHRIRGRSSPHGSHLLVVTVLFFFIPYGIMVLVAKGFGLEGSRVPWVIYSAMSMLIHRQWNLIFSRPSRH